MPEVAPAVHLPSENVDEVPVRTTRWARWELVGIGGGALAIALLLWSLAGFHRVPTYEGWAVWKAFGEGAQGWWMTPGGSEWASSAGRPLEALPHRIGYALTADTFLGFNVVSMLAFVARGIGAYLLLRELLRGHRAAAAAGALVFALSPAAEGMMIDRAIHVQWAGALAIGGFAALMIAVRTSRIGLAVLAAVLASAALMMYEVVLPVVALMPVYAVVAAAARRRAVGVVAVYCGGVLLTGVYLLWFRSELTWTYQSSISSLRLPLADQEGLNATLDALRWEFGGSFFDTLRNATPLDRPEMDGAGWAVALTITAAGLLAVVLLSRKRFERPASGWRELLEPVALGLVWIAASLSILLPFAPYRYETLRAHSVAQFGAVLILAAVLKFVLGRLRVVGFLLAAAALVAASFVAGKNALMWKQQSDFQSQLISAFVAETATADPRTTVLINDRTDRLGHVYQMGPYGQYLGIARNLVVDEPIHVVVCTAGKGSIGDTETGNCVFTPETVEVEPFAGWPDSVFFVRDQILELELVGGDEPQLRRLHGGVERSAADLPARARAALPCVIGERCADEAVAAPLPQVPVFQDFVRQDRYEDGPYRGAPIEDFTELHRGTSERWTTTTESAVYADLPEGRYIVRARIIGTSVGAEEVDVLRLSLNGEELPTTPILDGGDLVLEAVGTVGSGSPRADRVGIHGPLRDEPEHWEHGLGMAVDWISVDEAP